MSDNEARDSRSLSPVGNNKGSRSPGSDRSWSNGIRSKTSRSPSRTPRRSHSPHHSHSPRRSRSPRRLHSRSPSFSPPRKGKRYRSRSRSHSPVRRRKRRSYSRSRSRSYDRHRRSLSRSPTYRREKRNSPYRRQRSRSRSPYSSRHRQTASRYDPSHSKVVGVFGLSMYTNERDLRDMFTEYGPIKEVQIIYDHQTGRSRGFGFIYFDDLEDAIEAKEQCNGIEVDGRKIRVDYSITKRAHTPTPGVYMGNPTSSSGSSGSRYSRGDRDRDYRRDRDYDRYERSRY